MDQRAIDQIKAERDELRKRAAWYEELRQATDGGSESMTHEDAIEHVNALAAENKVLREALEGVMPWVVTQEFACHGMKCREALCQSCSTETEEAAERAIAASSVAYSVLTKEATNV